MSDQDARAASRSSKTRAPLLLGIALLSIVALAAATQPWVTLSLAEGSAAVDSLSVNGQQTNASLSPVAIAALASALALTIAGPVVRRLLGLLVVLLGAGIAVMAGAVSSDPLAAASGGLAEATGLAGDAQAELVSSTVLSPFIPVTLVVGILIALLGAAVVILSGRWRGSGRKYRSGVPRGPRASDEAPDRISDWDELSGGYDPSERDAAAPGSDDRDEPGDESSESAATR